MKSRRTAAPASPRPSSSRQSEHISAGGHGCTGAARQMTKRRPRVSRLFRFEGQRSASTRRAPLEGGKDGICHQGHALQACPTRREGHNTDATARYHQRRSRGEQGQVGSVERASTRTRSGRPFACTKEATRPQGSVSLKGPATVVFRRAIARAERSTLERMHLASTRS